MVNIKLKSVLILIVLSVIWGSSFILMKEGLKAYSPEVVAALRITIAAVVFLPYLLTKLKQITKLKYIILFALLEVGIPPFLYTFAQTVIDSSTAGILNSLVPLFTLITGAIIFGVRVTLLKTAGVLIGLSGAVFLVLFAPGSADVINFSNAFGFLIVLATLMYGLGGNILKEYLQDVSSMVITATSFVCMGIPAGLFLLTTDVMSLPLSDPANLRAFAAIATLSIVGSALAIVLFNVVIKQSDALFASSVTYLIPFVAIFWGVLDGEAIGYVHAVSLLIILSGIYLSNKGTFDKNPVK